MRRSRRREVAETFGQLRLIRTAVGSGSPSSAAIRFEFGLERTYRPRMSDMVKSSSWNE